MQEWSCTVSGPDSAGFLQLGLISTSPQTPQALARDEQGPITRTRPSETGEIVNQGTGNEAHPPVCHALRSAPGPGCAARRKT